jgi:hypothetical protein
MVRCFLAHSCGESPLPMPWYMRSHNIWNHPLLSLILGGWIPGWGEWGEAATAPQTHAGYSPNKTLPATNPPYMWTNKRLFYSRMYRIYEKMGGCPHALKEIWRRGELMGGNRMSRGAEVPPTHTRSSNRGYQRWFEITNGMPVDE